MGVDDASNGLESLKDRVLSADTELIRTHLIKQIILSDLSE